MGAPASARTPSEEHVQDEQRGGDAVGLVEQLTKLQAKAQARTGKTFPIIVIQG